jgi:glycerate dehydrogenase
MKIVVLDGYTLNPGDNPWTELEGLGELAVYDRTPAEQILERARGAEVLLTNKTPLAASTLEQLPVLRFISVLATGYNIVDVAAARRRGVPVSNVPEYGTQSVAQHVFALVLELCQQVGLHNAAVKASVWATAADFCFWKQAPVELAGLTMGIVGFGRIGRRVGELAHSFGMNVLAAGGSQRPAPSYGSFEWTDIGDLFSRADIVTLHCPLTDENAKFVDRGLLRCMKPTAYLINAARGGLVDESALADALHAGQLAGAAVDVVSIEPIRPDNPLLRARNCIITPHLAWASLAARRRLMAATVGNVEGFLAGRPVNVVN